MNADPIRLGLSHRVAEARELINHLRAAEANAPPLSPPSALGAVVRGLFFVSCYGALEYSVSEGSRTFIAFLSGYGVRNRHLQWSINAVALDAQLTSIANRGDKKKWEARRSIFERFEDGSLCSTSDTVFGTYVHNIWPQTIKEIFDCFSIDKPIASDPAQIPYLIELVERRNEIAHGRKTASDASSGRTAQDLGQILDAVYGVCLYFLSSLEEHGSEKKFIQPAYRRKYPLTATP